MYYRNQSACRVQPLLAELILWIEGHEYIYIATWH